MAIPIYEYPSTKQEAVDVILRMAQLWNLEVNIRSLQQQEKVVEYDKNICDCETCGHGGHQGDVYCSGCGFKIKWIN